MFHNVKYNTILYTKVKKVKCSLDLLWVLSFTRYSDTRLWKGPMRRLGGWVKAYRPFAVKRGKVGMDGVPYSKSFS